MAQLKYGTILCRMSKKSVIDFKDNHDNPEKGSEVFIPILSVITGLINLAVEGLYGAEVLKEYPVVVTICDDPRWGDYSCNTCLRLSPVLKQTPLNIAKSISYRINENIKNTEKADFFDDISAAPNGFLNFKISFCWLQDLLNRINSNSISYGVQELNLKNTLLAGKKIMVEYTDPNPFKTFHMGHLMPNTVGESLARMFEYAGATVKRASYQGDVGMHVAQSVWGMMQLCPEGGWMMPEAGGESEADGESPEDDEGGEDIKKGSKLKAQVEFLGKCYALGAKAYEEDESVQKEIKEINYLVYIVAQAQLQKDSGWKPQVDYKKHLEDVGIDYSLVKKLYETGRKWSLEFFETIYKLLGTKFDFYYFESLTGEYGYKIVSKYLGQSVFENDNGAVIFRGDSYGLHNRVFINSQGLPTYEAKDLGLAFVKKEDFDYDLSYIITAVEQAEYFKVVLKALEQIDPELAAKTKHISNGMMTLSTGKMSSRLGSVVPVDELVDALASIVYEKTLENSAIDSEKVRAGIAQKIAVGALKYAILRQKLGKDIMYDREKSLQLNGDTGPYLQYTFVRALSIMEKAGFKLEMADFKSEGAALNGVKLNSEEELLLRHLSHFNEGVLKAIEELLPSYICTYLQELCSLFNNFYAKLPILGAKDPLSKNLRLSLVNATGVVLKAGLNLLGIEAVEKM